MNKNLSFRFTGQTERKISFVLHEPDNESEGSSNTTLTIQGEEREQGRLLVLKKLLNAKEI
jgi:hypothetical protein